MKENIEKLIILWKNGKGLINNMKDNIKLFLIVTLKNIATIVCFTILAIVFNKWWIVLFSLLLYSSVTIKGDDK